MNIPITGAFDVQKHPYGCKPKTALGAGKVYFFLSLGWFMPVPSIFGEK